MSNSVTNGRTTDIVRASARTRTPLALCTLILLTTGAFAADPKPNTTVPEYGPMTFADARRATADWAKARPGATPEMLTELSRLWRQVDPASDPQTLHGIVIQSFTTADPDTAAFVAGCRLADAPLVPPTDEVWRISEVPFYRANLGLFYGRYLTNRRMFDEAVDVFRDVDPTLCVDPAGYWFFRAVAEQGLLLPEPALESLVNLTERTVGVPSRYERAAELMRLDLEAMKEESLDQIERWMGDAERRLALARSGRRVQDRQAEIVAGLDELIKKIEAQQGGGGGSGGGEGGGNSNQSGGAADESRVKGATAPGETDDKKFSRESGWGSLPPKEQAKAKNLINRNFPPNYQRAIEEYLKKLARRGPQGTP